LGKLSGELVKERRQRKTRKTENFLAKKRTYRRGGQKRFPGGQRGKWRDTLTSGNVQVNRTIIKKKKGGEELGLSSAKGYRRRRKGQRTGMVAEKSKRRSKKEDKAKEDLKGEGESKDSALVKSW